LTHAKRRGYKLSNRRSSVKLVKDNHTLKREHHDGDLVKSLSPPATRVEIGAPGEDGQDPMINANQEAEDASENHVPTSDPIANNNLVIPQETANGNQVGSHELVADTPEGAAHDGITDTTQGADHEIVTASNQGASHELFADSSQGAAHEIVSDSTQGATHDIDVNEGQIISHEPITSDGSLPPTINEKGSSFIHNSKKVPLQGELLSPINTLQPIGPHILPQLADTNHLANNVTDVDIEDEPSNQLAKTIELDDTATNANIEHLQEQQDLKPKQIAHNTAHVDDEKVISITHPLLKPNEYNENLKEMLAKTKADLGAI